MMTRNVLTISVMACIVILLSLPDVHSEQRIYTKLIDNANIYLMPGETWPFYQGYSFSLKSISGDRGWMVLRLNDTIVKTAVLSPGETFSYNVTDADSGERILISLYVTGIYSGEDTDLVTFSSVYQYNDLNLPEATPFPTQGPDNHDNDSTSNSTSRINSPGFEILITAIIICIYIILIRK